MKRAIPNASTHRVIGIRIAEQVVPSSREILASLPVGSQAGLCRQAGSAKGIPVEHLTDKNQNITDGKTQ